MTIQRSEFNSQCIDLIDRSRSIDDYDWVLLEVKGGMVKECNENTKKLSDTENVLFLSRKIIRNNPPGLIIKEYNVIYSDPYEVPVLYFSISDRGGCPVAFENMATDQGPAITQVEHPYFFRPFYMIHPCRTKDLMDLVIINNNADSRGHYLLTWLSTIASCIRLDLDERLFN